MHPLLNLVAGRDAHYPIHSLIAAYLQPSDIFRLSRTCKTLSSFYDDVRRTQWNINAKLLHVFKDVSAFRILQLQTMALIAGDFATGFFLRQEKPGNRLALFVRAGDGAHSLVNFLESEGYVLVEEGRSNSSDLEKTFRYDKASTQSCKKIRIRVYCTVDTPIRSVLSHMVTSVNMAVISWNKAYCLFPAQTVLQRELLPMRGLSPEDKADEDYIRCSLRKYVQAGYKLKDARWNDIPGQPISKAHMGAFGPWRQLGDKYSWVIPLEGIQAPSAVDLSLGYSTFTMHASRDPAHSSAIRPYAVKSDIFESPVLKYPYTIGPEEAHEDYPHDVLYEAINRALMHQLSLMEPHHRPVNYSDYIDLIPSDYLLEMGELGDFDLPQWWKYYDDEVCAFMEELRATRIT